MTETIPRGELVVLFPRLPLLEDRLSLYQKRAHAAREKNRRLSAFLLTLDVTEFGDAIKGPRATARRSGSTGSQV